MLVREECAGPNAVMLLVVNVEKKSEQVVADNDEKWW
jgi:hypothetical protein